MSSLFKFRKWGKRPVWEYGVMVFVVLLCIVVAIFLMPKSEIWTLRLQALTGSAWAPQTLGYLYSSGTRTKQDLEKAAFWYRWAAWRGSMEDRYKTAKIYEEGRGVEQDYAKAVFWYRKIAPTGREQEWEPRNAWSKLVDIYEQGRPGVAQDYAEAVRWLRKLDEIGELDFGEVPYKLGQMHEKGLGVKQDYKEAFFWYEKAAKHGHKQAIHETANMYEKGLGVAQDDKKAFSLYAQLAKDRDAAKYVSANTAYTLGNMYRNGLGVEQDEEKAIEWYQKSNAATALYALGVIYEKRGAQEAEKGETPNSYRDALYYYEKAAEQGYLDAEQKARALDPIVAELPHGLGGMPASEEEWDSFLVWTGTTLEEERQKAEQGDVTAQFNMGLRYATGEEGVAQDNAQAIFWYKKAIKKRKGEPQSRAQRAAQRNLKRLYEKMRNGDEDELQGESLVNFRILTGLTLEEERQKAEQGDVAAQFSMGTRYDTGIGVPQDDARAIEWYEKAIEKRKGKPRSRVQRAAQSNLKRLYEKMRNDDEDELPGESLGDFRMLTDSTLEEERQKAKQGDVVAQFNMGIRYENGNEVPQDNAQAIFWYKKAVKKRKKVTQSVYSLETERELQRAAQRNIDRLSAEMAKKTSANQQRPKHLLPAASDVPPARVLQENHP